MNRINKKDLIALVSESDYVENPKKNVDAYNRYLRTIEKVRRLQVRFPVKVEYDDPDEPVTLHCIYLTWEDYIEMERDTVLRLLNEVDEISFLPNDAFWQLSITIYTPKENASNVS